MSTQVRKGRTLMTAEQQAEHDAKICDDFDARFPVGTAVWYWTTLPFGPVLETRIRDGAWMLGCREPVCKVEGRSGGVSIFHITEPDESRRESIEFVVNSTTR